MGMTFIFNINATDKWEDIFEQWDKEIKEERENHPERSYIEIKTASYYEILNIGPKILPQLIQLEKENKGKNITLLIREISKMKCESVFDEKRKVYIYKDYPDYVYAPPGFHPEKDINNADSIWIYWWDKGRKLAPELFAKKYSAYEEAKKSNNDEKIKDTYTKLQNMGVIILPNLLEKIKNGEKDLIPMFSYLSNEKVPVDASANDCEKWWNKNKSQYAEILNY